MLLIMETLNFLLQYKFRKFPTFSEKFLKIIGRKWITSNLRRMHTIWFALCDFCMLWIKKRKHAVTLLRSCSICAFECVTSDTTEKSTKLYALDWDARKSEPEREWKRKRNSEKEYADYHKNQTLRICFASFFFWLH